MTTDGYQRIDIGSLEKSPLRSSTTYEENELASQIVDEHFPDYEIKSQVSVRFTYFMSAVIFLNTLQLGAHCQWDPTEYPILGKILMVSEVCFIACYVFEIIVKLKILGARKYFCGPASLWNSFDFALTIFMLMQFLAHDLHLFLNKEHTRILDGMRILRVVRVFRIFRVLRRIPQLTIVVEGVTKSLSALGWIILLLCLLVYAFGMFFTMAIQPDTFKTGFPYGSPFGSLFASMNTLISMSMGGVWQEVMDPISMSQPYMVPFFFMYILSVQCGLLNLMIGVICDATSATKTRIEWQKNRQILKQLSGAWLHNITLSGLKLTKMEELEGQELEDFKETRKQVIQDILQDLLDKQLVDFPRGATVTDIYEMLDDEGHGDLGHKEFVIGIGRLLLADNFQMSCDHLIRLGRARRIHREEERRQEARAAAAEERARAAEERIAEASAAAVAAEGRAAAAEQHAASSQDRLARIEQQLATVLTKLDSKK